jgi:very-short-patch-repair endonuclease
VVTVVIPWQRKAVAVSGSRVLRSRSVLSLSVQGLRATRVTTTVIDMAGAPDLSDDDVVALAARTCQLGRTTAPQLLAELRSRRAHPRRDLLEVALGDVGDGVESAGEFRFLRDVARRHGLPRLLSQTPTGDGSGRRDFESVEHGVIVEIDGFRWHQETFRRDRKRDRTAARDGKVTLRATWLDVAVEPCELAIDVGLSLQRRGWTGRLVPCSSSCPVQDLT